MEPSSTSSKEPWPKVHPSDNSGIEAARLVALMKEEISRDPSAPVGQYSPGLSVGLQGQVGSECRDAVHARIPICRFKLQALGILYLSVTLLEQ